MTSINIFPVSTVENTTSYLALAGDKRSYGRTAGEALDALTTQMDERETGTLVILQNQQPDKFFSAQAQQKLTELMTEWRTARDEEVSLPTDQQQELEALVEAELLASAERTKTAIDNLQR